MRPSFLPSLLLSLLLGLDSAFPSSIALVCLLSFPAISNAARCGCGNIWWDILLSLTEGGRGAGGAARVDTSAAAVDRYCTVVEICFLQLLLPFLAGMDFTPC